MHTAQESSVHGEEGATATGLDLAYRLTRRQALHAALGVVAASVLAACGAPAGGSARASSATSSAPGPGGTSIDIGGDDAIGGRFEPATLSVRVGDTVTWQNTSSIIHTVTCDPAGSFEDEHRLPDGAEPISSGGISPGDAFEVTFDVAGEYAYSCIHHAGHVGTVIVQA